MSWRKSTVLGPPGRVQYPVLSQLTPLGPELLEAAETEDEKQAGRGVGPWWGGRGGTPCGWR